MSTSSTAAHALPAGTAGRILDEGYGPGAWHGADMKAALSDVEASFAFWRPGPGRHNIAEIALHHAYYVHVVRTALSGREGEPFVLHGEDWFELSSEKTFSWERVKSTVESEHEALRQLADDLDAGRTRLSVPNEERLKLVLGITCHAAYHAGQIQLVKKLGDERKSPE